jgi:hypothetical protein
MSKDIMVYKLDGKGWAVALNPKTNCQLWHFGTKKRALEKAKELEMSNE